MKKTLQEKTTFVKVDFTGKKNSDQEFAACTFKNCTFLNTDLSNCDFLDCTFEECSFSMVKLNNTGLKNVIFTGCKLLGADFTKCKDFLLAFSFTGCNLDYTMFQRKKIRKTLFRECSVKDADFSEADLTESSFLQCDLARTVFQHTILEKVDFRSAWNYSFDLDQNRVKKARFTSQGIAGLLDKYQITIE